MSPGRCRSVKKNVNCLLACAVHQTAFTLLTCTSKVVVFSFLPGSNSRYCTHIYKTIKSIKRMRVLDTLLLLLSLTLCQTARPFQVPLSITSSLTMTSRSLTIIEPNLSMKHLQMSLTSNSAGNATNEHDHFSLRDRLRQVTGFSFTAFRATLRGITGISLTAIYASAVASTSSFVRNAMKVVLSVFPSWVRSCCCYRC